MEKANIKALIKHILKVDYPSIKDSPSVQKSADPFFRKSNACKVPKKPGVLKFNKV